jgi:hypothetical protein
MHRFLTQRQLRRKFFIGQPAELLRAPAVCRAFDHTTNFPVSSKLQKLSMPIQRGLTFPYIEMRKPPEGGFLIQQQIGVAWS